MRRRCSDEGYANYDNYGGRGIRVCDEWEDSFEAFYRDMGPRPGGYSLDRINPDGNYEPNNCRWADEYTQAYNKRVSPSNVSGVKGVFLNNDRWIATLRYRGEDLIRSVHRDKEEAVAARKRAEEDVAFLESPEGQEMIEEMFTSSTDDIPFD